MQGNLGRPLTSTAFSAETEMDDMPIGVGHGVDKSTKPIVSVERFVSVETTDSNRHWKKPRLILVGG